MLRVISKTSTDEEYVIWNLAARDYPDVDLYDIIGVVETLLEDDVFGQMFFDGVLDRTLNIVSLYAKDTG